VSLPDSMTIDQIQYNVEKPEYFNRNATIRIKGSNTYFFEYPLSFNSKSANTIKLDGIRAKEFYIIIKNLDNPSLKFAAIDCYQLNHYCIAKLEKNNVYEFHFGNPSAEFPEYDLKYFQSAIPENMKILQPGIVLQIPEKAKAVEEVKKDFFSDKRFIWGALVIVILLLGFVTFRMMKNIQ
jgi:hypothetical protein